MKYLAFVLGAVLLVLVLILSCSNARDDHAAGQPGSVGIGGGGDDDNNDTSPDDDDSSPAAITVALIYKDDANVSDFQAVFFAYDITLVTVFEEDVTTADFTDVDVILVDSNTEWFENEKVIAITQAQLPVLGVYYGGGILLDKLGKEIGWSGGFQDLGVTQAVVQAPSHDVFNKPNDLGVEDLEFIALFTGGVALNYHDLIDLPANVEILTERPAGTAYSSITIEGDAYIYWGYDISPSFLTSTGLKLLVNCLYYLSEKEG
jgi:hypothetical protein